MKRILGVVLIGLLLAGVWSASVSAFLRTHGAHGGQGGAALTASMCGKFGCGEVSASCVDECVRSAIKAAEWFAVIPLLPVLLAAAAAALAILILAGRPILREDALRAHRDLKIILKTQKRE